jgi:hypothetical protein
MTDRAMASMSWAGRLCAQLAVALCLVAFGFGGAVERGLGTHIGSGSTLTSAVPADDSGDHPSKSAELRDHCCHGLAAIPRPSPYGATKRLSFATVVAWTSVPSTDGREPLIDLPPPRA